jgi:hypothetical protein
MLTNQENAAPCCETVNVPKAEYELHKKLIDHFTALFDTYGATGIRESLWEVLTFAVGSKEFVHCDDIERSQMVIFCKDISHTLLFVNTSLEKAGIKIIN